MADQSHRLPGIVENTSITTEFSPLASCLDLTIVLLVFLANIFAATKHKATQLRGRLKNTKSHAGAVTG